MSILENKEWTNLWWDEAQDQDLPRAFLVGDSITCGYFPHVINILGDKLRITAMGTSKAIDNPFFIPEMEFVYKQYGYKYNIVHFNNGLHGWHLSTKEYEVNYEKTIQYILENFKAEKIILATCTPMSVPGNLEEIDKEKDVLIRERNEVIKKIGLKYNLVVEDLYISMIDLPLYHCEDAVHFTEEGKSAQAKIVSKSLINAL